MTSSLITVVTVYAPYHAHLVERARASVARQTLPAQHIVYEDTEQRGAGYARNRALEQVETPFVVFLDADDEIEPRFCELTYAAFCGMGGLYLVYTDMQTDREVLHAPICAWVDRTWHAITCLIPTTWVREIGGFDEQLPGGEDTDFFMRLSLADHCGRRLPLPLFRYHTSDSVRSKSWYNTSAYHDTQLEWARTYGGAIMGCCGGENAPVVYGQTQQPGDLLARPIWGGKRNYIGRASHRHYGRIDKNVLVWLDPRDYNQRDWQLVETPTVPSAAAQSPHRVSKAPQAATITPDADLLKLGMAMGFNPPPYETTPPRVNAPATDVKSRAAGVLGKLNTQPTYNNAAMADYSDAQVTTGSNIGAVVQVSNTEVSRIAFPEIQSRSKHIFVLPRKDYPSYADFEALARLSGIPVRKGEITYAETPIYVSPEPNFDWMAMRPGIWWILEYAGDYAPTREQVADMKALGWRVWASDKSWAGQHDVEYVPLASDARLVREHTLEIDDSTTALGYDVTMLGYMTPRRQVMKDRLSYLRWPEDYPGAGDERDAILKATRLMLHVHQHDRSVYAAPLRYAVAAAYKMPVISETIADSGIYAGAIKFADYDALGDVVKVEAAKKRTGNHAGVKLHKRLCIETDFAKEVRKALGDA